jgi:hypothetical protein
VLREIGLPPVIYGGSLTIGLVRSKLEEHRIRDAPLEVLEPGDPVEAGPFGLEFILNLATGAGERNSLGDRAFSGTDHSTYDRYYPCKK